MPRPKKVATANNGAVSTIKAVYDWTRFERPEVTKDLNLSQLVGLYEALDEAGHDFLQLWFEEAPNAAADAWGSITNGALPFPYGAQRLAA